MDRFHNLQVKDIRSTGNRAVCITFHIPEEQRADFSFKPGQYITIRTTLNGQEIRRSYSICSSPAEVDISVGVKMTKEGLFSVFANESLKIGDTLEVSRPEGRFVLNPESTNRLHYIGIAAGSGITPVLSILKAALEGEPDSTFSLIYGNRSPQEAMFMDELEALKSRYPDRFAVEYLYSKSDEEGALFGRIDRSTINYIVKNKFDQKSFDRYYICGPEPMIEVAKSLFMENGAAQDDILYELFTSSDQEAQDITPGSAVSVKVTLDDEVEDFTMNAKDSILQAALDQGLEAPYSCQGGICSTCIARLTEGTAEMRKNQILTDQEVAEGFILACQAHPTSNSIAVDFDDI